MSYFTSKGKATAWNAWMKYDEVTIAFQYISEPQDHLDADMIKILEKFTITLYDQTNNRDDINQARKDLFCSGGRPVTSIPPTAASLVEHMKRASYQEGQIWGQADTLVPICMPSPAQWEWVDDGTCWVPKWNDLPANIAVEEKVPEAFPKLYETVNTLCKAKYISTYKPNQDCLENLLGILRTKGDLYDSPSPLVTLYRLRDIILSSNVGKVPQNSHTLEDDEMFFLGLLLQQVKVPTPEVAPTEDELLFISEEDLENLMLEEIEVDDRSADLSNNLGLTEMEQDGLRYLAGYILFKNKDLAKEKKLGCYTYKNHNLLPNWMQHLSYGGLMEASESFFKEIKEMEKLFLIQMGPLYLKGPNINSRISGYVIENMSGSDSILIRSFIRRRLFMRIKFLTCKSKLFETKKELKANLQEEKKLSKLAL
ncbi:hypothetical protein V9T40_011376 [Parthenolecanium corni]|uniref:Uncharacterized protein n=1 Tax=Parthenolecanium corni TaxID=536013 RepID=A0AAN9T5Y7_9HEMI